MIFNKENISGRLKRLIDASSYSRTEIAEKAGITKQSLYKYENGLITNIPSDKIELLAKILHSTPAYIMGWDEEIENSKDNEKFIDIIQDLELTEEQKLEVIKYARAIKIMENQGSN